jgi:hypothetical protein
MADPSSSSPAVTPSSETKKPNKYQILRAKYNSLQEQFKTTSENEKHLQGEFEAITSRLKAAVDITQCREYLENGEMDHYIEWSAQLIYDKEENESKTIEELEKKLEDASGHISQLDRDGKFEKGRADMMKELLDQEREKTKKLNLEKTQLMNDLKDAERVSGEQKDTIRKHETTITTLEATLTTRDATIEAHAAKARSNITPTPLLVAEIVPEHPGTMAAIQTPIVVAEIVPEEIDTMEDMVAQQPGTMEPTDILPRTCGTMTYIIAAISCALLALGCALLYNYLCSPPPITEIHVTTEVIGLTPPTPLFPEPILPGFDPMSSNFPHTTHLTNANKVISLFDLGAVGLVVTFLAKCYF